MPRSLSQVGDALADWTSSSISGTLQKLTLAKLQPDSLYEVEMAGKNCAGLGQPAMMTFRTGKGKKKEVTLALSFGKGCGTLHFGVKRRSMRCSLSELLAGSVDLFEGSFCPRREFI